MDEILVRHTVYSDNLNTSTTNKIRQRVSQRTKELVTHAEADNADGFITERFNMICYRFGGGIRIIISMAIVNHVEIITLGVDEPFDHVFRGIENSRENVIANVVASTMKSTDMTRPILAAGGAPDDGRGRDKP